MENQSIQWRVEKRLVADLILWDRNPRKITPEKYEKLKERIKARGFHDVLKIDIDNTVLSGNQRKNALVDLGIVEVHVMVPDRKLTDIERDQVGLESNISDGEYDWDKMKNDFAPEFLMDIGFDKNQLNFFNLEDDEFDEDKELASIGEITVRKGDVYSLGGHKIMCGDSAILADCERLMAGEKGNLIFTDPPYNVNYKSEAGNSYSEGKYGSFGNIFNDNKSDADCLEFYTVVLKNLYKISEDNACIYWWLAFNSNALINILAFQNAGYKMSQQIIWLKEHMVFGHQDYHRLCENCFFGWKAGKKHFTNKKIANYKDVWSLSVEDFSLLPDVWYENRDKTNEYIHPTQKPVRLAERALKKSSEREGIVIDLFGGSGSTLIACEQSGRRARLMELDPKYVQLVIRRWEKFTGRVSEKMQ